MAKVFKKMKAVELFDEGITDVELIALRLRTSPSYVANALAAAGRVPAYRDLYTSTQTDQSRYSRAFSGVLRFRDMEAARTSVEALDHLYEAFRALGDRRGMFHAEYIALTGVHRALGSGKREEAEVFAEWLRDRLTRNELEEAEITNLCERDREERELEAEAVAV